LLEPATNARFEPIKAFYATRRMSALTAALLKTIKIQQGFAKDF
jgi:hypothetical protein